MIFHTLCHVLLLYRSQIYIVLVTCISQQEVAADAKPLQCVVAYL